MLSLVLLAEFKVMSHMSGCLQILPVKWYRSMITNLKDAFNLLRFLVHLCGSVYCVRHGFA